MKMNTETTIYVNRQIDRVFLLALARSIDGVDILPDKQNQLETQLAKITLEKNPYASDLGPHASEDAFLRYPCRLILEAKQSPPKADCPFQLSANDIVFDPRSYESYIDFVANLLQALWKNGIAAVAACDFEEMLQKTAE